MSCSTLSQGLVGLNVAMASLPEGFCPTSMQELANAIAARLVVTPNTNSSSFAVGSIPPSSNVGPWLKDCLLWYVYDDSTATYIPMAKGGFNQAVYYVASDTFVVPAEIYRIKVEAGGGGGGGSSASGTTAAGGGGGGYGMQIFDVIPGQAISFIVGSGGGIGSPTGTAGGDTTFLGMTARGGKGGSNVPMVGGDGGTVTGAIMGVQGGGGQVNETTGARGSFGGSSHMGGFGGVNGDASNPTIINGKVPGGGGAGAASGQGAGSGAGGAVLIQY